MATEIVELLMYLRSCLIVYLFPGCNNYHAVYNICHLLNMNNGNYISL